MPSPARRGPAGSTGRPRTVVLDTSALLAGSGPGAATPTAAGVQAWLCPPAVRAEIRPGGATGRAIERAESGGLQVHAPTEAGLAKVHDTAASTGDLGVLSHADREVVALAWDETQKGPTELWSDDYAVQNVARRLGVAVRGVLSTGGHADRTWFVRCTGCGRYPDVPPDTPCPICGSALKRTRRGPKPGER